tara:strand:+ start:3262 stop:7476 length:4215 start_codon:yes stop_codon:yes gene_type:complete
MSRFDAVKNVLKTEQSIDDGTGAVVRSVPVTKEDDKPNAFVDAALAIPRGVEGAVQDVYGFVDKLLLADVLPDYDERLLGKSQTGIGGFIEGVSNFATGFIPIVGAMGKAGKINKIAKIVGNGKVSRNSKAIAKDFLRGNRPKLTSKQHKLIKNLKTSKKELILRSAGAGALTDALVFEGQEQRLADFINEYPSLKNPISIYLASDENDTEIEGRLKNVLEGLLIEGGVLGAGALIVPVMKSLKLIKTKRSNIAKGMDEEDAVEDAVSKSDLNEKDIQDARQPKNIVDEHTTGQSTGSRVDPKPKETETGQPKETETAQPKEKDPNIRSFGLLPDGTQFGLRTRFNNRDTFRKWVDKQNNEFTTKSEAHRKEFLAGDKGRDPVLRQEFEENVFANRKALDKIINDERMLFESEMTRFSKYARQVQQRLNKKVIAEENQKRVNKQSIGDTTKLTGAEKVKAFTKHYRDLLNESVKKQGKDVSIETASIQAIKSAIRTVKGEDEIASLSKALAEKFIKEESVAKLSASQLANINKREARKFGNILKNHDTDDWILEINKHAGNIKELRKIRADQKALYYMQRVSAENLVEAARKALVDLQGSPLGNKPKIRQQAEVQEALEIFGAMQRMWGLYGREYGLGLVQRKFLYKNGEYQARKIGIDNKNSDEILQGYLNEARARTGDKRFLEKLIMTMEDGADIDTVIKSLEDLTVGKRLSKGFEITREYWMNALLSGPSTQIVNIMGNALTMLMRQVETGMGAALSGNLPLLRATFDFHHTMETVKDSIKLAAKAVKLGDGITVGAQRTVAIENIEGGKSFTADNFEKAFKGQADGTLRETPLGKFLDGLGKVVRVPSSALLAGDEFFKSMNYRTYIKTELTAKGYERGLRGKELSSFVVKEFNNHVTNLGRAFNEEGIVGEAIEQANKKGLKFAEKEIFIEDYVSKAKAMRNRSSTFSAMEREALTERAKHETLINTFTADQNIPLLKEVQSAIKRVPFLSFVVPFVRTPANILVFGLQRTPFGVAYTGGKKLLGNTSLLRKASEESKVRLESKDPRVAADELGRLSTAVLTNTAIIYYLMSNKNFITGFGPTEKAEREAWKNAGHQEYSFRIKQADGKDKYFSYQRLDPMATMLGLMADTVDVIQNNISESDEGTNDALGTLFASMALVTKNNITNKSYVQGFDALLKAVADPQTQGTKFIANIIGGFTPNVFNQAMNMKDERLIRESRGSFDYFLKRNPLTEGKLPVKRDLLGKEMTIETGGGLGGVLNPIYRKTFDDDIVYNEIYRLGGMTKPKPKIASGNIDMRNYQLEGENDTAYDFFLKNSGELKINGRTMHESLQRLITSKEYDELSDELSGQEFEIESPKMRALKRVIGAYRNQAKINSFEKYPELKDTFSRYYIEKGKMR